MEIGGGVSVSRAVHDAALALRVDSVTAEVVTALRGTGIRALVLKGPSTAAWLYDDGAVRPYGDSDLLVAPSSFRPAGEVIRELGFHPVAYAWHRHSETWRRSPGASYVDLHRSLIGAQASPVAVWRELVADTDALDVGGIEVEILRPSARAFHVALHAAQHGVDVQGPLEDLSRALRVADENVWSEAAELARRIEAQAAFAAGLRLDPDGARLAQRLELPAASPPAAVALRAGSGTPVALALESLSREHSVRAWARLLLGALFPSRLYMRHWSGLHMKRWPAALRQAPLGPGLAYLWRPFWILVRLPNAITALRRARRGQA